MNKDLFPPKVVAAREVRLDGGSGEIVEVMARCSSEAVEAYDWSWDELRAYGGYSPYTHVAQVGAVSYVVRVEEDGS